MSRTVSEGDGGEVDLFDVVVYVQASIETEIEIEMEFRIISGEAEVRDRNGDGVDAIFGERDARIVLIRTLLPGMTRLPLLFQVRNDLRAEDPIECVTTKVESGDVERTTFHCDQVPPAGVLPVPPPTNYSCTFTLCIEDNDGQFCCCCCCCCCE